MYIERLKTKYKQILESSRTQKNTEEESNSLKETRSKNLQNLRVLTEYSQNVSHNSTMNPSSAYILALKERIAQATHNLAKKDSELATLKEEIVRKDERIRILEEDIADSHMSIEGVEKKLVEAKVYSGSLEKEIDSMRREIKSISMDRELLLKQSQYYKGETAKVSKQKTNQHREIESLQRSLKQISSLKTENKHLKDDVKRMQEIINQMCQNKLTTEFTDKHYLGKPLKESSMWFSQNLVGEVEHFLKKEQVGQGNKKLLSNLVKFIDKYTASLSKSKAASSGNSRTKTSNKSSHVRSASMCQPTFANTMYDMGTSVIKKTQGLGTTVLKKSILINKYKKLDARKLTSESIQLSQSCQVSVFEQVLQEFRKTLTEALAEKTVRPKTILSLADEMRSALMELLQYHGY